MFGFFTTKKTDVINHWYTPVPHFNGSQQDFYAAVEKAIKEQKVPGLDIARVEFAEGGPLSARREYLRMTRERLVFDICAAPFGTNYFYSCRFAEIPAVVELWQLLVLVAGLGIAGIVSFIVCAKIFGLLAPIVWPVAWLGFIALCIYAMRNSMAIGLSDLDKMLLQTPVINAVYEAWFRKETYYRQDTRLMYLTVVEAVVKKLVEDETSAKGVKILTEYEHAPILGELYKKSQRHFGDRHESKTE